MINPSERVLIIGKLRGGKTGFFGAIAGIWPWGSGRILLPPVRTMMFISRRYYFPPCTLRDAIAYPSSLSQFTTEDYMAALERMRLANLAPGLDRIMNWDRELTGEEQQRLTFARLLLHMPRWVVLDEAIDYVDEDTRSLVYDIFDRELADAAIINISRVDTQRGFYGRIFHLGT
jgi:vitamin B12/bleomycin/antimicrobial peptide transport system ATP-binding/permease protein